MVEEYSEAPVLLNTTLVAVKVGAGAVEVGEADDAGAVPDAVPVSVAAAAGSVDAGEAEAAESLLSAMGPWPVPAPCSAPPWASARGATSSPSRASMIVDV